MRSVATLCAAAALAVGTAGVANATPINLVQNGDFSQTSTPAGARAVTAGTPTQLNYNPTYYLFSGASYGEFVNDWTTTGLLLSQNVVWFPNATAASGANAEDIDTSPILSYNRPLLPTSVSAPPGNGAFLGMQSNMTNSGVQQTINGLMAGQSYTLNFDWAATMDNIDTSAGETSQFTASIGNASFTTPTQTVSSDNGPPFLGFPTHSTPTFNGWLSESYTFVADSSSELLQFIAGGTPQGVPPYALLSNVSIDAVPVPEPGSFALLGTALLGLGFVVYRRKRHNGGSAG